VGEDKFTQSIGKGFYCTGGIIVDPELITHTFDKLGARLVEKSARGWQHLETLRENRLYFD
jgi:hypothetical protein